MILSYLINKLFACVSELPSTREDDEQVKKEIEKVRQAYIIVGFCT